MSIPTRWLPHVRPQWVCAYPSLQDVAGGPWLPLRSLPILGYKAFEHYTVLNVVPPMSLQNPTNLLAFRLPSGRQGHGAERREDGRMRMSTANNRTFELSLGLALDKTGLTRGYRYWPTVRQMRWVLSRVAHLSFS